MYYISPSVHTQLIRTLSRHILYVNSINKVTSTRNYGAIQYVLNSVSVASTFYLYLILHISRFNPNDFLFSGVALGSCAVVTIGIKKICLKKKLKGAGKNGKVAATSADTATIDAVTNATNAAIVPPVN